MREAWARKCVCLMDLRPNNWYINRAKLDSVREAWQRGEQSKLPPVDVANIDGVLSLIDGHSRAFAALERGESHIEANVSTLEGIEGSTALYRHIHKQGPALGIETIADLRDRIIEPEEHARLWVRYCTEWLEAHRSVETKEDPA